jgi:hypothetical protein
MSGAARSRSSSGRHLHSGRCCSASCARQPRIRSQRQCSVDSWPSLLLALARAIDQPDAILRATLAGSQLIGLALARYVVAVEPLAPALPEILVRALAPTVQRYLTGDLAGAERPADLTEAGAALP